MQTEMKIQKGEGIVFVEFEQSNTIKRFVLPPSDDLQSRLISLVNKYPNLILVRSGSAIITSLDEMNPHTDGLVGVPSTPVNSVNLDLLGNHPILPMGTARYSPELIDEIVQLNPSLYQESDDIPKNQVTIHDITENLTAPVEQDVSSSLSEQLRGQLAQQALTKKSGAALLPAPQVVEKPVLTLHEALLLKEKKQKEAEEKIKPTPSAVSVEVIKASPKSKIDVILDKLSHLQAVVTHGLEAEVTGPELQTWFSQHVKTIGEEKTFAILASRIIK